MLELNIISSLTLDGRRSLTARLCNSRPINWLGEISMSFYMCHIIVIGILANVFGSPLESDDLDGTTGSWSEGSSLNHSSSSSEHPPGGVSSAGGDPPPSPVIVALFPLLPMPVGLAPLAVAISLLVGWLLTNFVEVPCQNFIRGWRCERTPTCCCCSGAPAQSYEKLSTEE